MITRPALLFLLIGTLAAGEEASAPIQPAFHERMQAITTLVSSGDGKAFDKMWDSKALGERALEGITITAKTRRDFIAGMTGSFSWGDAIIQSVGESGSYRLLRVQRREGRIFALFRMISDDSMMNYHDLEFTGDGPGAKIVDVYVYTTAEPLSETMRLLAVPALAQQEGFDLGKLLGIKPGNDLDAFQRITRLFRMGDHEGVVEVFAAAPESFRRSKPALMLRLRAAQQLGNEQHQAAIQDLVIAFPQNKALDFLMIDGHTMKKEWDQGLACIDRLDREVGGDPYLDSTRASLLMEAGRLPEARDKAEAVVRNVPDITQGWWMLVTVALRQKDHRATAEVLTKMQKRFGLTFGDLSGIDDYRDFVMSQEYVAWKKAQDQSAKPTPP